MKPKDKPRVERPMPYVRDSLWRGRDWRDEAHMQAGAITWCLEVAGRRHHRSLDGAEPLVVFEAVEADALIPLPPAGFELARWSTPKVGPDCHVKVAKALYSVPWHHIGRRVDAREGERTVEVFIDGKVIKTWARIERGRQTDWGDYPPEKVAFFMRTPRCGAAAGPVSWARRSPPWSPRCWRSTPCTAAIGPRRGRPRREVQRRAPRRRLRPGRRGGDPSYRTVKGILAAGTECEPAAETDTTPAAPAHLHGPQGLFDTEEAS